jgi:hypothetical protein
MKLTMVVAGTEPFSIAGSTRVVTHSVVKVDTGGMAGLVAPLVGKQPTDPHGWMLEGEAPAFVRSEAPMFMRGPVWQTELVSPVWPRAR